MYWLLALSLVTIDPASPAPPVTVSGFVDGARLHSLCSAAQSDPDAAGPLCAGYIIGSVDQLLARQGLRALARRTVCLPNNLSVDQLVAAIGQKLVQYPRAKPAAASSMVRNALEALYPCNPKPDVSRR